MLGLCYTSQGRLQDGIDMYKKALRLDPSSVDTWSNLGIAHKEVRGDVYISLPTSAQTYTNQRVVP